MTHSEGSHSSIVSTDSDVKEDSPQTGSEISKNDEIEARQSGKSAPVIMEDRIVPHTQILCASGEDVEIAERGRTNSRSSDSSADTHCTLPDEHDHQVAAPHRNRSRSRAQSSVRSVRPDPVEVPRSQRRGLFARICVLPEITNAYDYSRSKKWILTAIIAIAGAAAPMGSSIILPALGDIERDFHSSPTISNLSVAMYMLSMSIFPLWWSSFSETLGRRTIYIVSFFLFLVFNVGAAVSNSITTFVILRVLSGGAAASVQAVGAGTISDIWEIRERGRAMGMFYLGPLCGPLIAPILGGVLAEFLGWRSCQWFLAIYGGCLCIFIFFCLPETLHHHRPIAAEAGHEAVQEVAAHGEKFDATMPALSRASTKQSIEIKTRKYLGIARRVLLDPLRIILYLQFPAVAVCVIYAAISFASLYILNISVQSTFAKPPYNFGTIILGLLYIPNSVGYILSSIFGGRWVDKIMHREARKAGRIDEKGRLKFRPEDRMKENAWLACFMFPAAMIAYGWMAHFGVNVAGPLVANFFFGMGSMLIFALVTTMLTEFMPRKASNGVAVNNFVRNILSCVGVIATQPLINAIGNGWLFTGLGVITLSVGCCTIWAMKHYGDHWRITMDERMGRVMGD